MAVSSLSLFCIFDCFSSFKRLYSSNKTLINDSIFSLIGFPSGIVNEPPEGEEVANFSPTSAGGLDDSLLPSPVSLAFISLYSLTSCFNNLCNV